MQQKNLFMPWLKKTSSCIKSSMLKLHVKSLELGFTKHIISIVIDAMKHHHFLVNFLRCKIYLSLRNFPVHSIKHRINSKKNCACLFMAHFSKIFWESKLRSVLFYKISSNIIKKKFSLRNHTEICNFSRFFVVLNNKQNPGRLEVERNEEQIQRNFSLFLSVLVIFFHLLE